MAHKVMELCERRCVCVWRGGGGGGISLLFSAKLGE